MGMLQAMSDALERSMPRVLQGAFSKKRPRPAPPLPSFEEAMGRIGYNKGKTIYDTAKKEDTFEESLWWKKKNNVDKEAKEITYGGNLALSESAPNTDMLDLGELSGFLDHLGDDEDN